jgi:hypothetical protein
MLRDLQHRINTTGDGHCKLLPCQQQAPAADITSFKTILLHHPKSIFCDVNDTLPVPAAAGPRLPVVEENATNDGNGVTRFVW